MSKELKGLTVFHKMQATGNDFIVCETKQDIQKISSNFTKFVKHMCDRHYGVGADGFVLLAKKNKNWFWRFFNSDGSETQVCGNATRCVSLYLQKKSNAKKVKWSGTLGEFRGEKVRKGIFSTSWTKFQFDNSNLGVPEDLMELLTGFNDHGLAGVYFLNVGVPHLVLLNHEVWNPEQRFSHNSLLRRFPSLGSEGANVTWVSLKTKETVTFERGVESETLACGSGALAAFYAVGEYRKINNQEIKTPNEAFLFPGGWMEVKLAKDGSLWLQGEAAEVFKGNLKI